MAVLGKKFDATQHDTTQSDFELLPTGVYKLEVSASDIKEEDGNTTLALTYDVVEPEEFKSRRIFAYIDIENKDAQKQERGQKDFAKLCRAVGVFEVDDSELLHFITFTAKVQNSPAGVSKAGNAYKAKNRVQKFYFPDEGNIPEPAVDAAQPTSQPPANDNRQSANPSTARSTNNGGAAASKPAGSRPWGPKAA